MNWRRRPTFSAKAFSPVTERGPATDFSPPTSRSPLDAPFLNLVESTRRARPECADDLFTANGGRVELDVPGPQSVCHGIRDRDRWRNRAPLSESFDPEWIHGRRDLLVLDLEARKLRRGRYVVIHERRRQELAVLVVGEVFPKSRTDALGGAADDLSFGQGRIHEHTRIV